MYMENNTEDMNEQLNTTMSASFAEINKALELISDNLDRILSNPSTIKST